MLGSLFKIVAFLSKTVAYCLKLSHSSKIVATCLNLSLILSYVPAPRHTHLKEPFMGTFTAGTTWPSPILTHQARSYSTTRPAPTAPSGPLLPALPAPPGQPCQQTRPAKPADQARGAPPTRPSVPTDRGPTLPAVPPNPARRVLALSSGQRVLALSSG